MKGRARCACIVVLVAGPLAAEGMAANRREADPRRRGEELAQRLRTAAPGSTVVVEAGTYVVTAGLVVEKDGITLRGAGVGKTTIRASFAGQNTAILTIGAPSFATATKGRKWRLGRAAVETDKRLVLSAVVAPDGVGAGDTLLVRAANDAAFLERIGARRWRKTFPYVRQTLARVHAVRGAEITLERPLGVAFPAGAQVLLAPVVTDVTVEGLTLIYDLGGTPDPARYENARPANAVEGVLVRGAVAPVLRNIEITDAGSHAVHLDGVLYPRVEGVTARGSWNKGKQGNGYFRISRTYYGSFKNIVLRGLRHLTIQWSSHDNKLTGIDADCDINFHGGFTQRNRVQAAALVPRTGHPWGRITRTPDTATWAPPDGAGNVVFDAAGVEMVP